MGVISIVTGDYKPTYNWGGTTLYIFSNGHLYTSTKHLGFTQVGPVGFALATDFASCSAFSSFLAVHKAKGRPRPHALKGFLSGFSCVFSSSQGQFLTTKLFSKSSKQLEVLNSFWRFHQRYWGWNRISDFS